MANPEHLRILKQGVKAWNEWRRQNAALHPVLGGARLNGAHLKKVNLGAADLRGVELCGANLREARLCAANLSKAELGSTTLVKADLTYACLQSANLRKADLTRADLRCADLSGTDLRRANLAWANLRRASLPHANLSWANLQGAYLRRADLRRTNLRGAILAGGDIDVAANLTDADLRGATFTPEGRPIGGASFLDLSACVGLDSAKFSEPDFLQDYLAKAFCYAHEPDIPEAKEWRTFLDLALANIGILRRVYSAESSPRQLAEVVRVITGELIEHLKKHPKALHEIKPRQFEELIAEILGSYGWRVQLTPPTRDGGYDIFAVSKDIEPGVTSSWVIECKKYRPEKKVGVDIVRALYGVKSDLRIANALLATTSHFTKGAQAFKASRYDVALRDYEAILEWINEYRPHPDGKLYIKDHKLMLPGEA